MTDLLRTYDERGHLTRSCGLGCRENTVPPCPCICGGKAHNRTYERAVNDVGENLTDILRVLRILRHARVWVHPDVLAYRQREGLPPLPDRRHDRHNS